MNATLSCKYNAQRIVIPGDLNSVQHRISRLGPLKDRKLLATQKYKPLSCIFPLEEIPLQNLIDARNLKEKKKNMIIEAQFG